MATIPISDLKLLIRDKSKYKQAEDELKRLLALGIGKHDRKHGEIKISDAAVRLLLNKRGFAHWQILLTAINYYCPTSCIIKHGLHTSNTRLYRWLLEQRVITRLPRLKQYSTWHAFG